MADTPRRGEVWPVCCVRLLVLYRIMHVAFAALFFFAILTLWVPGYWPVSVFQAGIFALAAVAVWRARLAPPAFVWPIVPLSFAVVWGLFQWFTGRTAYVIDTKLALLRWATFLCVFLVGITIFRDDAVRRWFRSAMLWFAFLVAALATVQTFTSKGKVFWLFDTPYTDFVMGPILYRNHYAEFIEAVPPIALDLAVRRERDALLYSGMAVHTTRYRAARYFRWTLCSRLATVFTQAYRKHTALPY